MQERKLKLGVVFYPYGTNGNNAGSEVPSIRNWFAHMVKVASADPRIEEGIWTQDFNDTPITMTRNRSVIEARKAGIDVLIMVDSDMHPDCELGRDTDAKPFFESSFDFVYKHWDKGPSVVCAPYCGPPPNENVYVFRWSRMETDSPNDPCRLEAYGREEAELMQGIQPCAAQPTGLIMWDMRAFDLTDPLHIYNALRAEGYSKSEAKLRTRGWFYYEFGDIYESEKDSTEDVTATRDISFNGMLKLGYSPIYCNWDAWAGHWKTKCVQKPRSLKADMVEAKYRHAVNRGVQMGQRIIQLTDNIPDMPHAEPGSQEAPAGIEPSGRAQVERNGKAEKPTAPGRVLRGDCPSVRRNGRAGKRHQNGVRQR